MLTEITQLEAAAIGKNFVPMECPCSVWESLHKQQLAQISFSCIIYFY